MGPINTNSQAEPAATSAMEIHHFAHHHPLQLSQNHNPQTPCSACSHPSSTTAYGCQLCNYYLHLTCSKMPQQLQHPFDTNNNHILRLLPMPAYSEGKFSCDACGHQGSGFSYHCADCRIDLHVLCAALPAMAFVAGHEHQLTRVFAPPYANKQFSCDVCRMTGSNTWLYRCGACQFDVHLGCVRGSQQTKGAARSVSYPPPQTQQRYYQPQPQPQPQVYDPNGYVQGQPVVGHPANSPMQVQPVYYNHAAVATAGPKPGGSQLANSIGNGLAEGIANAVAQAATAAALGAVFGGDAAGGGGGGDFAMEGGGVMYLFSKYLVRDLC